MKFSRTEKMPTRPSQESNLGLQQTRLVLYRLSYRDQARNQTRMSDILTILDLPSCSIWPPLTGGRFWPFPLPFATIANGLPPKLRQASEGMTNINDKVEEDLNIRKKEWSWTMKFSRMEKMPTRRSQESNLGLQQTRLMLYRLSYQAETQPERATWSRRVESE